MITTSIISKLKLHQNIFIGHLAGLSTQEYLWKPHPEHWCLLEIICHLYDSEVDDFRFRLQFCLVNPDKKPPPIFPVEWVKDRKYIEQDFAVMTSKFIRARKASINYLKKLENADWSKGYVHSEFGRISAHFLLENWLAHDLLHIRQITRLKYLYLKEHSEEPIEYAGNW